MDAVNNLSAIQSQLQKALNSLNSFIPLDEQNDIVEIPVGGENRPVLEALHECNILIATKKNRLDDQQKRS